MKENITLGDIAAIQTGPFGSQLHASDYVENGIPVIMPTNIGNNLNIEVDAIAKINEDDLYRLSRYQVFEDDIVYSRRGDVERCAFITKSQNNWLCGTGCLRVRFKKGDIVPKFFAYQLSTDEAKGWISGHAVGSTMPNLNSSILAQVPLIKPDVEEQRAIAAVLSNLDDKIDLLRGQNATLEAMAEALFKQRFVVEAKQEWKEKPLSGVASFLNGLPCQKHRPANFVERLPVLKIRELSNGISQDSEWASSTVPKEYIVKFGDVIFSWSGSLMVKIWDGEDCVLNQHLFKVTSHEYPKWFYYFWCKQHLQEFISISESKATTMGHIKRGDLDAAMVRVPKRSEIESMSNIITPYLTKLEENKAQIRTLQKLRDTLLPKLMSGEVRVSLD